MQKTEKFQVLIFDNTWKNLVLGPLWNLSGPKALKQGFSQKEFVR